MAKVLQHRRGTTAEHSNFTGAAGEITFDTTAKRLVAHDGSTKGGISMAKVSELESAKTELQGKIDQVSSSLDPRILDAASQADILEAVGQVTGGGSVSQPTLEGLQSQISANASNIASVANRPTPVRYVTETWKSGTSWYAKYNDGWIEQGGQITGTQITFLVPFSDTNYSVTGASTTYVNAGMSNGIGSLTTTGCQMGSYNNAGVRWRACGY